MCESLEVENIAIESIKINYLGSRIAVEVNKSEDLITKGIMGKE
jgi:hypothetical protein